jgi:hypothetical protein
VFQAWLGGGSNLALPQPCFKHDKEVYLSDILPWEGCQCWKWKCDNSIQKTNWLSLSKKVSQLGDRNPRVHVSSMTRRGPQTLLSRSRVSTMTGRCTYPIHHQRGASVENGSVIIQYRRQFGWAYQKESFLGSRTPLSRGHVSSMTKRVVEHCSPDVSSMPGECIYPIYYQSCQWWKLNGIWTPTIVNPSPTI